ncbi:YraN family protein [bacterium]|nr:YraN family protein [bacterium]
MINKSGHPNPHELGSSAEQSAAAFLKRKGWRILKMNYRTRYGEIDIIGMDKDLLVFVEVKSSSRQNGWFPGDRIDSKKQKKIRLVASEYIAKHEIPAGGIRFDAVLMTAAKRGEWLINHIIDAFRINEENV